MRVLKWLFHPVYLLVIIVVVATYINRDLVLGELTKSDEVTTLIEKMDGVIASLQNDNEQAAKQPVSQAETSLKQTGVPEEKSLPVQRADIPGPINGIRQDFAAGGSADARNEVVDTSSNTQLQAGDDIAASNAGTVDRTEIAISDETKDEGTSPERHEPEDAGSSDMRDSLAPKVTAEQILTTWQQARIAAWQGDFAGAIEYYQTVVTLQPDNFDAYGEMGNVMLRSGDREGAAESYYQAAKLINKTPQRVVAWNLLNVIAGLDPQKAEMLYQELTQP